jgi:DNA-directed RNA polymerase subunit K/omega
MINRSMDANAFEFVIVASLRAKQLMKGCTPRLPLGNHKRTVMAQLEVLSGKVVASDFRTP